MTEHILSDFKRKFNSATYNSKQKWNNKTCQCECKNYLKYEKDNNWNHSSCICEYNKYSKSVVDISVTECDEIVIVMNNLSITKTNTIATNVTRDWYILHAVLLTIILLLMILIICHNY